MTELDEFDRAVLVTYDPTANESLKSKAVEYCNSVKNAPEGWKFCIQKFFNSSNIQVKFFGLIVLQETIQHKHSNLTANDQLLLRNSLISYIKDYLPKLPQTSDSKVIKNKFAQIVALLFKTEYPQAWPTFFTELLSCLTIGDSSIDIFLRIMSNIDDEIINKLMLRNTEEVARSNEIKDFMRDHAVRDIVTTWYTILETYKTSNVELCKDCLENIRRYISWIDINLIANDQFVPLFFQFLSSEQLREKACECIHELVNKGMPDPVAKVGLISKLKITSVFNNISMSDDTDFLIEVAKIINTTGLELLASIKEIQTLVLQQKASPEHIAAAQNMVEESVVLVFKFMNNEDDDVSSSTLRFAHAYLNTLKSITLSPKQSEFIHTILQIIRNKMKYDTSYNFDNPEEDEIAFLDLRKELGTLWKTLILISTQTVASFVHSTLTTVIANVTKLPFADVEVAITLLLAMGDGISDATMKSLEGFFSEEILLLSSSNISLYPHPAVTLVYFDAITRYIRYLPTNPEALKNILVTFFDGRGIRNPHSTIRSRVCYLFQRLVKSHLANLQPFLPSIMQALMPCLVVSLEMQNNLTFDDQINLFDAIGALIGTVPRPDQEAYISQVLTPLIGQLEEIIQKQLYKNDTPDKPIFTNLLMHIVSCIGTFSKGFNGQKESGTLFKKTLTDVLTILGLFPGHEEIRSKCIFYMHRMIECLGSDVLQYVSVLITQCMSNCGLKDFLEFVRLINQFMSRFKEQMLPVIDSLLMQIIERFYSLIGAISQSVLPVTPQGVPNGNPNGPITSPEVEREILEVKKNYYLFISTIVSSNLSAVLRSPTNAPHLNQILKTILEGCIQTKDISQCFIVIKKLVEQWAGSDPGSLPGFNSFVFEEITPLLFKEPIRPDFDLHDAGVHLIIQEIVGTLKAAWTKCGKEYSAYVMNVLLPSLQCPPPVAEQFVFHLENTPLKEFKTIFVSFISSYKTKPKT